MPLEVSQCRKLRELDLKNTYVITLPREIANLGNMIYINMDNCPLKDSLANTYGSGIATVHQFFQRKETRAIFKVTLFHASSRTRFLFRLQEKLFDKLTEWIYPSIPKELIYEKVEELFKVLKDCNTEMLKKMYRNCNMLFPVKFEHLDLLVLRQKLENLYEEGNAREDIAQIELRLKSHFLDEDLHVVVALATDIYKTVEDQGTIDEFFKFKKHIFTEPLAYLTAQSLLDNLSKYKEMKRQERLDTIAQLKDNIESLYAEESECLVLCLARG